MCDLYNLLCHIWLKFGYLWIIYKVVSFISVSYVRNAFQIVYACVVLFCELWW